MQDIPRKKISFHNLDLVLMHHRQWLESKGRLGKRAELKGIDLSGRELLGVILIKKFKISRCQSKRLMSFKQNKGDQAPQILPVCDYNQNRIILAFIGRSGNRLI